MIKVSVLIMTYNHEGFIRQAIDSVLMQHTDFIFEIIISEDCSTDNTRATVLEYSQKHPDKIKLLLSEKNLHNNDIVTRGLAAAQGLYTALLDGDDYWTSANKLQQQADFLDSHPNCTVSFHNALVVDESNMKSSFNWTPSDIPEITSINDIWQGNYIATSSVMFRNGVLRGIPEWYKSLFPITDWPLHILHAEKGNIGFINKVMSVYRHHPGGMYSPYSEYRKQDETLKFYLTMNYNLDYKYDRIINEAVSKYFFEWAEEYLTRDDYSMARKCLRKCLLANPFSRHIPFLHLAGLFLRLFVFRGLAKHASLQVNNE